MAYRVRQCRSSEELGQAWGAIGHYFGWVPEPEEVERYAKLLPAERTHAVFDDGRIVAGAGGARLRPDRCRARWRSRARESRSWARCRRTGGADFSPA